MNDRQKAMEAAGWRCAVEGKPGVYIKNEPTPPSHWHVSRERLREFIVQYGGSDELLSHFDDVAERKPIGGHVRGTQAIIEGQNEGNK